MVIDGSPKPAQEIAMDEDWDYWEPDQIVDLDVTGDPQLDQFGYQSPRGPGPRRGSIVCPSGTGWRRPNGTGSSGSAGATG